MGRLFCGRGIARVYSSGTLLCFESAIPYAFKRPIPIAHRVNSLVYIKIWIQGFGNPNIIPMHMHYLYAYLYYTYDCPSGYSAAIHLMVSIDLEARGIITKQMRPISHVDRNSCMRAHKPASTAI